MTTTAAQLNNSILQFRAERINPNACSPEQARELEKLTTNPPSDLTICKDGSRSLVGKHTLNDGTPCVLKYYYPKNLVKKINYGLRGSRCMRSWITARVFEQLGIPTAAPMMIHENKKASGIIIKQSFLACRLAPGISLHNLTDENSIHKVAPQLKKAFTIMAGSRISHGDLKANNIIVDEKHRIHFIDLDGAAILSSKKKWSTLWKRDNNRFLRNWPKDSLAYHLFSQTMKLD